MALKRLILKCSAGCQELLLAQLWEHGTLGVEERDAGSGRVELQAYFDDAFDPRVFPAALPDEWAVEACWEAAEPRDWQREAESHWEPIAVGGRFFVAPQWCRTPTPPGRLRLVVHPGQASGTGYFAPTQLALEALERGVQPGDLVLDAGTGSGILARAAALLGAKGVVACDIDFTATLEAGEAFRRDHIAVALFNGSPRSLRHQLFEVAVANLNSWTLLGLADELARVVKPSGLLITSGIRQRRLEQVAAALEQSGVAVEQVLARECWRCLLCRNRNDTVRSGG